MPNQYKIFEKTVRPWLLQKSIEMMQEKEEFFIELVMKLLEDRRPPDYIVSKLEKILMADTKDFVKGLWRFIYFEQLKIKAGLADKR